MFPLNQPRDLYSEHDDVPLAYSSGADDDGNESGESERRLVDLSRQYLHHLPNGFLTGPGVRFPADMIAELDLSHNRFTELPEVVFSLVNLQSLDVSNNELTALPAGIGGLNGLRAFAARNNRITAVPKQFRQLVRLEELNLSGNEIEVFPAEILALRNLRSLYLGANRLRALPNNIDSLALLQILYLGGNRLTEVPESVGNLTELASLALADNRFETVPSTLGKLSKLQSLALHNNQIRVLPTEIVTLANLANLSLRNNPLVTNFVNNVQFNPPSLKELCARTIRTNTTLTSSYGSQVPGCIARYLDSATMCVNPNCKGVYFEARAEHVKFTDFCGKFRIPLLQYLCSPSCTSTEPAVAYSSESEETDEEPTTSNRLRRVLLG
uniref:Leucine-rich repeat-containing protein 58 n=1 Tax=Panagrellus redivivus TaxID=6233 RepID=A0A7E4V9A8_PANRE